MQEALWKKNGLRVITHSYKPVTAHNSLFLYVPMGFRAVFGKELLQFCYVLAQKLFLSMKVCWGFFVVVIIIKPFFACTEVCNQ